MNPRGPWWSYIVNRLSVVAGVALVTIGINTSILDGTGSAREDSEVAVFVRQNGLTALDTRVPDIGTGDRDDETPELPTSSAVLPTPTADPSPTATDPTAVASAAATIVPASSTATATAVPEPTSPPAPVPTATPDRPAATATSAPADDEPEAAALRQQELDLITVATQPAAPVSGCDYHQATLHNVCADFLMYWLEHGGLPIMGYPLTESHEYEGTVYQYFERRLLVQEQSNSGISAAVISTATFNVEEIAAIEQRSQPVRPPVETCRPVPETQLTLCGDFRRYWEQFGALDVFGRPITGEFIENGLTVQYFEHARFESHPGIWPERFNVLLGRIAAEILDERFKGQ